MSARGDGDGIVRHRVRRGAYLDSIVLMQLQVGLSELEGVRDCGAVMATPTNLEQLDASGLAAGAADQDLRPDDLLIAVRADSEAAAEAALERIDALLARRQGASEGEDGRDGEASFRPRSLATATRQLSDAAWVAVSVPGRYAADVARDAIEAGKHVFLYSDNVALDDEVALKRQAAARGLLVMGPDCGTAIVGGTGLGFANRVARGPVGLIGASGTGLQAIASRLHALGTGVSHALGTGGRDLSAAVGAATTLQALDLLGRDAETAAIVLVSKPPPSEVAARVLAKARTIGKPVVVCFLGLVPPVRAVGPLRFARGLDDAADRAAKLVAGSASAGGTSAAGTSGPASAGFLRGLFAGGTLAYEALLQLRLFAAPLSSNTPVAGVARVEDPERCSGHAVLDLGADEYTVGRPHPMIDPALRLERLRREAADPEVGTILLDVVLGEGAHVDPAAGLASAIEQARRARPELRFLVLVLGTDRDPQDRDSQVERLRDAGAEVFDSLAGDDGALAAACLAVAPAQIDTDTDTEIDAVAPVDADLLDGVPAVINVGLEMFYDSLRAQGAPAVHVAWRPPAGGDDALAALVRRMKG